MALNLDVLLNEEDRQFREEVRNFLLQELTPELISASAHCTTVFCDKATALEWQRKLLKKGWLGPLWPKEYGGPGFTPTQRYLFESECARFGAPGLIPLGLRMVAPVIMRYGTQAQKDYYLPRILSGEDYWCQGYSEPGSGSDLASLQCRAELIDDHYIVNGTKIWTTHAHFANRIFCLVRTAKTAKPQRGISFLLIDLDSPGVSVTPIKTLAGDHELNQVFFDDVKVPKTNLLGEENQGWSCAKYLLEFERGGDVVSARLQKELDDIKDYCRRQPLEAALKHEVQRQMVELEVDISALQCVELTAVNSVNVNASTNSGPEVSVLASSLKVMATELEQQISKLAVLVVGSRALLSQHENHNDFETTAMAKFLNKRAASIYGGSNEIQRNIIAQTILSS